MVLNKGIRGLPLYRALFYLPSLLGASVAIAVLWRQLFAGDGLVNRSCWRSSASQGPSWISNPDYCALHAGRAERLAVRLADDHLPRRAAADPAGPLRGGAASTAPASARQFCKITLPLLTPVIFFNAVVQTIDAFKAFTPAFIICGGTGGPVDSTLFYTLYLYQEASPTSAWATPRRWPGSCVVIIAVFTAFSFLTSRYWVHYDD